MKALTFTGNTGQMPVDFRPIEKGTMIEGASDGDQIISYYTIDGVHYAGHFGTCSLSKGTVAKAMPDGGYPVITGFLPGMQINYAVYHEGQYWKVEWTGSYTKSGHTLWTAKLTDQTIEVKDNLFWSLNPEWPEISHEAQAMKTPVIGKSKLYLYFPIQQYLPKYYIPFSCKFKTIEASGKLTVTKNISQTSYTFTKSDMQRGYITLLITCMPFPNSTTKDTERVIKLKW
jgi:hypothetical protein